MTVSYSIILAPPCGYSPPITVTLYTSEKDAESWSNPVAKAVSGPDRAGKVIVSGLSPDTQYWVRFSANGKRVPWVIDSGYTLSGSIPIPCPPMLPLIVSTAAVTTTTVTLEYMITMSPPCGLDPPILFSLYASADDALNRRNPVATAMSGMERDGKVTVTGLTADTPYWVQGSSPDLRRFYSSTMTRTAAAPYCNATMKVDSRWSGYFITTIAVTNPTAEPLDGWQVSWSWPADQKISVLWNATQESTGPAVKTRNVSYNGQVAPGGTTVFGMIVAGSAPATSLPLTCSRA
ncbi:MAG TPA: cellulose binding domain-containing protein [Actinoplanes sp.]|nr:cellulose binding domain-containing protein [Actinoplanes sp.]